MDDKPARRNIPCGHQVVVIDGLDERLDARTPLLSLLGHAARDLLRVAFNAGDEGVREWVCL